MDVGGSDEVEYRRGEEEEDCCGECEEGGKTRHPGG